MAVGSEVIEHIVAESLHGGERVDVPGVAVPVPREAADPSAVRAAAAEPDRSPH
jgi:hypothetical protein